MEASGFVEVLGISVEARLSISSTKYEVFIAGNVLNLFQASLRISAGYSKSITGSSFDVEGNFKSDLFDKIARAVRDGLKKSADEADRHISAVQNKIRAAQAKLDNTINSLEDKKRKVDDAKRSFDYAIAKVESARRKVDNICHIKSCGSGKKQH